MNVELYSYDNLLQAFQALADRPYTLFFDSNRPSHPCSEWSFICWDPIETIQTKNGVIFLDNKKVGETDFFKFLQSRLDLHSIDETIRNILFQGGLAGYFGYDLGRQLEDIPNKTEDDLNLPDAALGIYTNVLAFDHTNKKAWKIGDTPIPTPSKNDNAANTELVWDKKTNDPDYLNNIKRVIDYIHKGEVYQVNLSRRFDTNLPNNFSPTAHYIKLRETNSAPFSAYMNFGDFQLSSSSPERFIQCKDNQVETRPIKGTLSDDQNPLKLLNSQKDRAENLMIVDLLRNDISKACIEHSVQVPELFKIETFEGLHHMVSTVTGRLKDNETALSLLKQCFPGGSITGAPKIRAMEIIEELEPTRRSSYCGAMGYIGFDGNMDTNIIIRTLIYKDGKAYLQTGSGIVSDSKLETELQEGLDKAQKIFESFKDIQQKEDAA
ncbi:MAG: anthranilate synthase component I family protein [Pseudomonadota bacterium]